MTALGPPTNSELRAIEIALDELISYLDTVGREGSLDDEELPSGKLYWAERKLKALVARYTPPAADEEADR